MSILTMYHDHTPYTLICTMFNMCQVVVGPTHSHHNGLYSTIDLVFVSKHIKVGSCETLPSLSNSDHCGVFTQNELKNNIHALRRLQPGLQPYRKH